MDEAIKLQNYKEESYINFIYHITSQFNALVVTTTDINSMHALAQNAHDRNASVKRNTFACIEAGKIRKHFPKNVPSPVTVPVNALQGNPIENNRAAVLNHILLQRAQESRLIRDFRESIHAAGINMRYS